MLVEISGEVTFSNVASLTRRLDDALAQDANLVVDLTQVPFIDSSGLSALLTAAAGARRRGGKVALVLPTDPPLSIFRFRGVEQLLELHTSRADALASQ